MTPALIFIIEINISIHQSIYSNLGGEVLADLRERVQDLHRPEVRDCVREQVRAEGNQNNQHYSLINSCKFYALI